MCFSAEADFVSGIVIGAVGIATIAKVKEPREIALGALPLAFAVHQIVEGFVWRSLDDGVPKSTSGLAVYLYVAFAWVVLPVFAPLAIMLVERNERRRRIMRAFVGVGAIAAAYLLWSMVTQDITAHIAEHTIQYGGVGSYATLATALYVVATCGAPLMSSHPRIRWFGIANLFAVAVIAVIQAEGLTSVWCAWAAVVSVLIYLQFVAWRRAELEEKRALAPS